MGVGTKQSLSGPTQRSTGLQTGSKNGVNAHEDIRNKDTGSVFAELYTARQQHEEQKKNPPIPPDNVQLVRAAVAGDKDAMAQTLRNLEPTINAAISSIVGGDRRYVTRARLIAANALNDYNPDMGVELSTYVYNRLNGLRRLSADRGNFIHVPERSALERRQLEAIKQDYILENGVEPSLSELSDRSGFPLKKVGRLMSVFGTTTTSATRGEQGDSLEAKPRTATELYNDSFYAELPEIDKKIYEWSTGYMGSPQLDRATMAKRLGISEAAISQHVKKIDQRAANFDRMLNDTIYGGNNYGE